MFELASADRPSSPAAPVDRSSSAAASVDRPSSAALGTDVFSFNKKFSGSRFTIEIDETQKKSNTRLLATLNISKTRVLNLVQKMHFAFLFELVFSGCWPLQWS